MDGVQIRQAAATLLPETGRDRPFDTALAWVKDFPKTPSLANAFLEWFTPGVAKGFCS
jgi:hypothetical protein